MSRLEQPSLIGADWLGHSRLHGERYLLGRDGRCAEVTLEQHGHTFRLIADVRNGRGAGDAWHYERSLRVELGVGHPTVSTLNDQWTAWPLDAAAQSDGLLRDASSWLSSQLWDEDTARPAWFFDEDEHEHEPGTRQTRKDIDSLCERLGELALEHADPAAVSVARTLTGEVQFFAYSALLDDARGRVQQLIATCPALLSLAAGLSPHAGAGAELLDGIRAGRKLNVLIAEMLSVTTRRCRLADFDEQSVGLVRRAPSMSMRNLLHVLRAPGIDINDLQGCGGERRAWFDAMLSWSQLAPLLQCRESAMRLGSFISKHGVAVGGRHPESRFSEIIDWLTRSNATVPTRRTSPARVRHQIDHWHEALSYETEIDPATLLAPPPTPLRTVPELIIEPLLTAGDLVAEGTQMRHCVASLAPDAISGWISVFRATVDGTRATVAVIRGCGGWGLLEASGFANEPLDTDRIAILRFWVESLR